MLSTVKIYGIELSTKELDSSLEAIRQALDKHGKMFGDFRNSTEGVISNFDFSVPETIDFAIVDATIDGNRIAYYVNILKRDLEIAPDKLLIIPGYYKRNGVKLLRRVTMVPLVN